VRDAGADGDRGESRAGGGEKGADVSALAPPHRRHLRGIDPSLLDQVVDAAQHVPRVADAEVADVELPERLAVARAAAVVDLEHEGPARNPRVYWIGPVVNQRRAVGSGRAAVEHAEQRI